jgi:hypothetical protein
VTEQRVAPVPGVQESADPNRPGSGSPLYDRYYPPPGAPMPPASGSSLRQPPARLPVTPPVAVPAAPPNLRPERIAAAPAPNVLGQVVRRDRVPEPGTQVLFVSAARNGPRQAVTTDAQGTFRLTLASGGWLVYVSGHDNRPRFHSQIDVRDNEPRQVTLVSR